MQLSTQISLVFEPREHTAPHEWVAMENDNIEYEVRRPECLDTLSCALFWQLESLTIGSP